MDEIQEGTTEIIDLTQLMQSLTGQEVRGKPTAEISYPAPKRELVPGQELSRHRVRVSFEFDVECNTGPILSTGNDDDVKAYDLGLLKSFLQTDKALDLMVDAIGSQLGLNSPETFVQTFLPQIDTNCHTLFDNAIDGLSGEHVEYWRDIRDAPQPSSYETLLSICTEEVVECFKAEFVSSSYGIVEDAS